MEWTTTYKGWATLLPVDDDEDNLVQFSFPLDSPARYEIGSRNSDSVNLLLPKPAEDDRPIEAVLVVTDKGEVCLERPDGQNHPVTIDYAVIEPGHTSRNPLPFNVTVTFGPWAFKFVQPKSVFNREVLEKASGIRRCHVCSDNEKAVYILSCSHNICTECRRKGMARATPVPKGRGQIERPQSCPCQKRVTIGDATASVSSVTSNQAGKVVSDVNRIDWLRPSCENCNNRRELVDARDYHFCETCVQMLCPMCVLQRHQRHKLQPRAERLRDLDFIDQKLARTTRSLAAIDQQLKDLLSDEVIKGIMSRWHRLGNSMTQSMNSLDHKFFQCRCRQELDCILGRALGRGWNQGEAATFDQLVKEFGELKHHIDQLKNGEVSMSCTTNSDETSQSSGSSPSATETSSGTSTTSGPVTT